LWLFRQLGIPVQLLVQVFGCGSDVFAVAVLTGSAQFLLGFGDVVTQDTQGAGIISHDDTSDHSKSA
jgi:hypothetical protein